MGAIVVDVNSGKQNIEGNSIVYINDSSLPIKNDSQQSFVKKRN